MEGRCLYASCQEKDKRNTLDPRQSSFGCGVSCARLCCRLGPESRASQASRAFALSPSCRSFIDGWLVLHSRSDYPPASPDVHALSARPPGDGSRGYGYARRSHRTCAGRSAASHVRVLRHGIHARIHASPAWSCAETGGYAADSDFAAGLLLPFCVLKDEVPAVARRDAGR